MAEARTANSEFKRVYGNAKKQASELAGEASDAAQEVYEHARDKAADAARETAGSLERALRNTIETQPYTAVAIALGLGWLFGRMHRPF